MLIVHNSLLGCVEHFALLTENFLTNIFMTIDCLFIERSAAVVALNESYIVGIGIWAKVFEIIAFLGDFDRS